MMSSIHQKKTDSTDKIAVFFSEEGPQSKGLSTNYFDEYVSLKPSHFVASISFYLIQSHSTHPRHSRTQYFEVTLLGLNFTSFLLK